MASKRKKGAGKRKEPEGDGGAARPFWSGTLTFGLVSIPVELYPAVRPRRASLRMLDRDGTPLARRYYDPGTEREVPGDDLVRGYELDDGEFVVVEDEELEALEPEKTRDIDLRRFVPRSALDPVYFQRSYLLAPRETTKAYRLLATVMERKERAGIATFVMRGVEYLTAIVADGGILRAETLRFEEELRGPQDVGLSEPPRAPAAGKRRMAKAIRTLAAAALDESELEDEQAERLEALVRRKRSRSQDVVEAPEEEAAGEGSARVIDLLEVLKRSMAGQGEAGEAGGGARREARQADRDPAAASLDALNKAELYERAKALDIPGRSSMTRSQLVRALRDAA